MDVYIIKCTVPSSYMYRLAIIPGYSIGSQVASFTGMKESPLLAQKCFFGSSEFRSVRNRGNVYNADSEFKNGKSEKFALDQPCLLTMEFPMSTFLITSSNCGRTKESN